MKKFNRIVLDPFARRQFNKSSPPNVDFDPEEFEKIANEMYQKSQLVDGYAPFCKHIFVDNFAKVLMSVVEITPDNEKLLTTEYEARTEKQLPVLKRYFPKDKVDLKPAKYMDLILYSKEQVQKQCQAMGNQDPHKNVDYDYGIISVKPSDVPYETPMDPITIMRNSLGKEEGGSGVKLQREKYMESVKYWTNKAFAR